jgi:hypothetical protein
MSNTVRFKDGMFECDNCGHVTSSAALQAQRAPRSRWWGRLLIFTPVAIAVFAGCWWLWALVTASTMRVDCQSLYFFGLPAGGSCTITRLTEHALPPTVCWDVLFPCHNEGAMQAHACGPMPTRKGEIANVSLPKAEDVPGRQCGLGITGKIEVRNITPSYR